MQIQTKYFGELTINEDALIQFPHGIPGFLTEKAFVLLPLEEDSVFYVLQSTQTKELAFVVVNPFHFTKGYELNLDDNTIESLQITSEQDVQVFVIMSLKEPFQTSTANLQAPVIINHKKQIAKQYITNSKRYTTKEAIFTNKTTSKKGD
ncbi:flagellar assembly factor FliW [Paraliobacillus quinghaiensis]|uniref:Flagellar assembly factor FliW n=1 Tax=Paraliobacillus quinghaiensis TaxID=470815 RepID=A0A917WW77_9BACI|nr:flagellar assembly protein FliW [Paraliobacillus quinghaiensis]GGM35427.1 flagellar assembly factor FliW [Paraliobacillus quinghaiensis]